MIIVPPQPQIIIGISAGFARAGEPNHEGPLILKSLNRELIKPFSEFKSHIQRMQFIISGTKVGRKKATRKNANLRSSFEFSSTDTESADNRVRGTPKHTIYRVFPKDFIKTLSLNRFI